MRARPNSSGRRRRRFALHRIKTSATYDVHEASKLLGAHRGTIRNWLRQGLKSIDTRRPILVHGTDLKAFLMSRQQSRQRKCGADEFYCFKCRAPRKAWGGTADATPHSEKIVKLTALCAECETVMNKSTRTSDLPALAKLIDIRTRP